MNRIKDYEDLKKDIVKWLADYYWMHSGNIKGFVVGVSGGGFALHTGPPTGIKNIIYDGKKLSA